MNIRKQVQDLRKQYDDHQTLQQRNGFFDLATAGSIEALNKVLALLGDPASDGPEVTLLTPLTEDIEDEPNEAIPGEGVLNVEHPAGGGFTLVHTEEAEPGYNACKHNWPPKDPDEN